MNREKRLELTLCNRCAATYYGMSDRAIKRADKAQIIKESCDICRVGKGYEFVIKAVNKIKNM